MAISDLALEGSDLSGREARASDPNLDTLENTAQLTSPDTEVGERADAKGSDIRLASSVQYIPDIQGAFSISIPFRVMPVVAEFSEKVQMKMWRVSMDHRDDHGQK